MIKTYNLCYNFINLNIGYQMKTKVLFLILGTFLFSSLNAHDLNIQLKSFSKAVKKLEKRTLRTLKECNLDSLCVKSEYYDFVSKREKLVKSKLHIRTKHFKRVAKKTLKIESKCIVSTPNLAETCFQESDEEVLVAVMSLT